MFVRLIVSSSTTNAKITFKYTENKLEVNQNHIHYKNSKHKRRQLMVTLGNKQDMKHTKDKAKLQK